jgi:hypothetical protein
MKYFVREDSTPIEERYRVLKFVKLYIMLI